MRRCGLWSRLDGDDPMIRRQLHFHAFSGNNEPFSLHAPPLVRVRRETGQKSFAPHSDSLSFYGLMLRKRPPPHNGQKPSPKIEYVQTRTLDLCDIPMATTPGQGSSHGERAIAFLYATIPLPTSCKHTNQTNKPERPNRGCGDGTDFACVGTSRSEAIAEYSDSLAGRVMEERDCPRSQGEIVGSKRTSSMSGTSKFDRVTHAPVSRRQ